MNGFGNMPAPVLSKAQRAQHRIYALEHDTEIVPRGGHIATDQCPTCNPFWHMPGGVAAKVPTSRGSGHNPQNFLDRLEEPSFQVVK